MKTKMERHQANQEEFRKLMPLITSLTAEEQEVFMHMLKNKGTTLDNDLARTNTLIDNDCSDDFKAKLAKMSEDENFAKKNWYMHNKRTMKYADKKKMPVDK